MEEILDGQSPQKNPDCTPEAIVSDDIKIDQAVSKLKQLLTLKRALFDKVHTAIKTLIMSQRFPLNKSEIEESASLLKEELPFLGIASQATREEATMLAKIIAQVDIQAEKTPEDN